MRALLLAAVLIAGPECLWWELAGPADEVLIECDSGTGFYVCGQTPTSIDSGPFGVSSVNYFPVLRLDVSLEAGAQLDVRVRAVNSYGESGPSETVTIEWPAIL